MAEALLLRFAQEELVYLLRALKIPTLTGLGPRPLGDLDADHQALAMAVADRTLRARGVVRWDTSQERSLDPLAAGTLRDCASPDYSLAVEVRQPNQPALQYRYSFTRRVVIEHSLPEPGVHQFVALSTRADVLERLGRLVSYPAEVAGGGQPVQISLNRLTQARAIAATNPDEARRLLGSGPPIEIIPGLVSALAAPDVVEYLALWQGAPDQPAEHPPSASLTVLQGKQRLFCLRQQGGENAPVEVIPTTAAQVSEHIEQLVAPALQALASSAGG